jgi:hypothetical protein
MKRRLAVAGLAVVAALASTAGAAPTQSVTLHVHRFYSAECNCFKIQFRGRVSSGAADEYVVIMRQRCGTNFSTATGGASTVQGGSWLTETFILTEASATYRARWKGHLSKPWTFRPEIPVWPLRRVGRRIQFALSASEYPDLRMKGRLVELQRLAAGRWMRIRRARLAPSRQLYGKFTARFNVRTRGQTLRVAVPQKTAGPCYTATVTETLRT